MIANFKWIVLSIFIAIFLKVMLIPNTYPLPWTDGVPPGVKGSRIVITGASMGIGKAIAQECAKFDAGQIVIASRSEAKLNNVKKEIVDAGFKGLIHVIPVDLSDNKSCTQLIESSVSVMGGIDFLILNHITTSRFGTWLVDNKNSEEGHTFLNSMFTVNTFSYIWLATAAMDALKQSGGAIAVVSSLAGYVGTPKTSVYSATKHALHGFFNALRVEMKLLGINNVGITICAIGATDTEGASEVKTKLKTVTWDPPAPAALAIIRGTAARLQAIYHPHHLVFPVKILNTIAPELIQYIFEMIYTS